MPENLALVTYAGHPIDDPEAFVARNLPIPTPAADQLLVKLEATALNPIDTKLRQTLAPQTTPRIFGYDGVGTIVAKGAAVSDFAVDQRVLYAGTTKLAGSYQHYQLVPAILAAQAPTDASAADLAALPLVGLTAWEVLFEKMHLIPQANANRGKSLLIVNGAGGVGTMMAQLAHWAGVTVIATASVNHHAWLKAHHVDVALDYHSDLVQGVHKAGFKQVDHIALLYAPAPYLAAAITLIAPLGHVATIVTPSAPLDLAGLKPKAASFDQEYMFTKSDFGVNLDSTRQILDRLVALYQAHELDASVTQTAPFDLAHLRAATKALEAGHSIGKSVLLMKA